MRTRGLGVILALVATLAIASPAHAQDGVTATVDPQSGPRGSTVTISGEAPGTCSAVVHRPSEPALGDGQTPVVDGTYSVTFGVPGRVQPGPITVDLYCLENPDLSTAVTFEVTAESPRGLLAETGPVRATVVLAAGSVAFLLLGSALVATARIRQWLHSRRAATP